MRGFNGAASFDLPQGREQQRLVDLIHRISADLGKQVLHHRSQHVISVDGLPPGDLAGMPFAGKLLERVLVTDGTRVTGAFRFETRIPTLAQSPFRFLAKLARLLET